MKNFEQYYFSVEDQKIAHRIRPSIDTIRPAVQAVNLSFRQDIQKALADSKCDKIGILMSGGVDSSLLLAMLRSMTDKRIICFTAMTDNTDPDVLPSREISHLYHAKWIKCRLNKAYVTEQLAYLLPITKGGLYATAGDMAVDICMDYCQREGISELWAGNGLDMFFGGGVDPRQFGASNPPEFHNLFWRHAFELLKIRFYEQNDTTINKLAKKYNVKLVMPFETLDTILTSRSIAAHLFFQYGEDKYPVRLLAHQYGIPLHLSRRRKDALQHSSGIFELLRDYMYEALPSLTSDAVNFRMTKQYFKDNPNTDIQVFLNLLASLNTG